jgi:peptidoglycan hydrolase CwlO-like protein
MSNLSDAAEAISQMAEKYSAIVAVADVLKNLGSLEQAAAERKAAYDEAAKKQDDMLASVDEAAEHLAALHENIEIGQLDAEADAKAVVEAAKADAEAIKKDARNDADGVLAAAKTEAAAAIANANSTLANLASKTVAARNELNSVLSDVEDAQKALVSAQAAMDDLKKTAQNILG